LLAIAVSPQPFLPSWNYWLLNALFRVLPHSGTRDTVAQFFTDNALASTWMYAAAFYVLWRVEDARTAWRRARLLEIVCACALAVGVTLVFRPWVRWPAPSLVPGFRELYPTYFWNDGNPNCFPSHSTLIYFLVAAGLWPLKRWLSLALMALALLVISLPRVYTGGHYPVDIVAALLLAIVALWAVRRAGAHAGISARLERMSSLGWGGELLLFLWLFELANGFRSSFWIASLLVRAAHRLL
jgi:membrane-associated phospholipid phosphatase